MFKQTPRATAAVLCLISILWLTNIPCRAAESSDLTGTLRIDGTGVRRLQLFDGGGKMQSVEVVDGTVKLDPSTYTVTQIYLTNGLYCRSPRLPIVEVTADAEATLKVGGPLTQIIEAKQQGCMLVLSSFSEGVAGSRYAGRPAGADPPGFEIYKGNRKIDDGEFEYG